MRRTLFVFLFVNLSAILMAQSGPDSYLNAKSEYVCQQIANSETPLEQMDPRQAFMLRVEKGLEASNRLVEHLKKLEVQGIEDHQYDGYFDLYLAQSCPSYLRLLEASNTKYHDNQLKRKRFFELYHFARDLMMAEELADIIPYLQENQWEELAGELQEHFKAIQNLQWTSALMVTPYYRVDHLYVIEFIDINDPQHIFEFEIAYNQDPQSKIARWTINEYTEKNPKVEVIEVEEEIPPGY